MRVVTAYTAKPGPVFLSIVIALAVAPSGSSDYNDLARTPPMGWNNFNYFMGLTTETEVLHIVDRMVSTGLRDAGYVYVSLDDGWMDANRDSNGNLQADSTKYPSGMNALTRYIHSKGMKAGIYLTCGKTTYQSLPGSLGHEEADVRTIASYGFDLLKYDYKNDDSTENRDPKAENIRMSNLLKQADRPILFSMCEHGRSEPWSWAAKYANMWRIGPDIKDQWYGEYYDGGWGFNKLVDRAAYLAGSGGPGHWNDLDILVVGLDGRSSWMGPGCTATEYRSHFSMWCLTASPLFLGDSPATMSAETKQTVLNKEMIAVDQDSLGIPGRLASRSGELEVWVKPLLGNSWAVGLYNRTDSDQVMTLDWSQIGLPPEARVRLRDLWTKSDLWGPLPDGSFAGSYARTVASHECAVVRVESNATTGIPGPVDAAVASLEVRRTSEGWTFRCARECQEVSLLGMDGRITPLSGAPLSRLRRGSVQPGIYLLRILGPDGPHFQKVLIDR